MADVEGKKLTELRVIDLKTELERRGLDKTGNKAALLDRLAKAIIKEGGNPDECLIVPSGGVSRISPKKPVDTSIMIEDVLETEIQKEEFSNNFDGLDESSSNIADSNLVESNNDESVISISAQPDELEMDYQEPEPEQELEQEQEHEQEQEQELELEPEPELEIENEQEPTITTTSEEPASEKKSFIHSEENSNVSAVETNGVDNEDSINLTIGEDEENLLAEESESNDRLKDGGAKKRLEDSNDSNSSSSSKKGDSKGSGRAEIGASNKEGSSSLASGPSTTGIKSKQEGEGCKSSDLAGKGTKKDDKDKTSTTSANASSRNLWVSGLSSTTRATDLKQIFSKYGKVVGAKVVTNARTPGARCYGYVTMSTSDDAEKCIEYLHRTELHGRVISVEKAKGDSQQSHNRKREPITVKVDKKDEKEKTIESESIEKEAESTEEEKKIDESEKDAENKEVEEGDDREKRENSVDNKDEGSLKDCDTRSNKSSSKKSDRERANSREDKKRSWDRSRTSRSRSRERPRRDNEERERQRFREKERLMREEKRRRREDMERQRAIEREAARLEREREKLRLERERIEQEKAELLRLERERQKVEREKLERERLELKRQQMRLEENRRPPAPGLKRTSSDRRDTRDTFEPDRKRIATEHGNRRHSPPERGPDRRNDIIDRVPDRRIDSSGPSRYEGRSKDMGMQKGTFKRNDFNARNNRDDHQFNDNNRGGRDNIVRRDNRPNQNSMDHRPVKDRYERPSFQRDRDVHRSDDNHRNSRDNHNRYDNSKPNNPRNNRYAENTRQTGWHSGPPSKPFNSHSVNNRNEQHQSGWNSRSSDTRVNNSRWNNSNNMGNNMGGHPRSQMYQGGGPNQSYGVQQGNSGSYDRFDPYKGSMQNMRKY